MTNEFDFDDDDDDFDDDFNLWLNDEKTRFVNLQRLF